MSLPAGQHRILKQIEGMLATSDPRLSSLFVIFTRLAQGEAMPRLENLKARPVADRVARMLALGHRFRARPAARVRALLLLPAAMVALTCGAVIAVGFAGTGRGAPAKAPTARELVIKARHCRLPIARFPAYAAC